MSERRSHSKQKPKSSSSKARALIAANALRQHVKRRANVHGWDSAQQQLSQSFIQADTDGDGRLCSHELELFFELVLGNNNPLPKSARVVHALMNKILTICSPLASRPQNKTKNTSNNNTSLSWPDFSCISSFVAFDREEIYERVLLIATKTRKCIVEQHDGSPVGLWNLYSKPIRRSFRFPPGKAAAQERLMDFDSFLNLARHLHVGIDSISPHTQRLGLFEPFCDDVDSPPTHLSFKHATLQSFKTKLSELLKECRARSRAEREIAEAVGHVDDEIDDENTFGSYSHDKLQHDSLTTFTRSSQQPGSQHAVIEIAIVSTARHALTMWEAGFASCGECIVGSRALWCKRQGLKDFASRSEFALCRLSDVCVAQQQPGTVDGFIATPVAAATKQQEEKEVDIDVTNENTTIENEDIELDMKKNKKKNKKNKKKDKTSDRYKQLHERSKSTSDQISESQQYEPVMGILSSSPGKLFGFKKESNKSKQLPWRVWVQRDPNVSTYVCDIRTTVGNHEDYCDDLWQAPGFGYRVIAQYSGSETGFGLGVRRRLKSMSTGTTIFIWAQCSDRVSWANFAENLESSNKGLSATAQRAKEKRTLTNLTLKELAPKLRNQLRNQDIDFLATLNIKCFIVQFEKLNGPVSAKNSRELFEQLHLKLTDSEWEGLLDDDVEMYPFSGRELVRALYLQPAKAFEYMKHVYIENVWTKLSGEQVDDAFLSMDSQATGFVTNEEFKELTRSKFHLLDNDERLEAVMSLFDTHEDERVHYERMLAVLQRISYGELSDVVIGIRATEDNKDDKLKTVSDTRKVQSAKSLSTKLEQQALLRKGKESAEEIRLQLCKMVRKCQAVEDKVLHVFLRLFAAPHKKRGAAPECFDLPHQLVARFPRELSHLKSAKHLSEFIYRHVLYREIPDEETDGLGLGELSYDSATNIIGKEYGRNGKNGAMKKNKKNNNRQLMTRIVFTLLDFELFLKGPEAAAVVAKARIEDEKQKKEAEQNATRVVGDINLTTLVPFSIVQTVFKECAASNQPVGLFRHLKHECDGQVAVPLESFKRALETLELPLTCRQLIELLPWLDKNSNNSNNIILTPKPPAVVVDLNRFCLSVLCGPGVDVWTATVVLKMRMVRLVADAKQRGIGAEKIFTDVLMGAPVLATDKMDIIDEKEHNKLLPPWSDTGFETIVRMPILGEIHHDIDHQKVPHKDGDRLARGLRRMGIDIATDTQLEVLMNSLCGCRSESSKSAVSKPVRGPSITSDHEESGITSEQFLSFLSSPIYQSDTTFIEKDSISFNVFESAVTVFKRAYREATGQQHLKLAHLFPNDAVGFPHVLRSEFLLNLRRLKLAMHDSHLVVLADHFKCQDNMLVQHNRNSNNCNIGNDNNDNISCGRTDNQVHQYLANQETIQRLKNASNIGIKPHVDLAGFLFFFELSANLDHTAISTEVARLQFQLLRIRKQTGQGIGAHLSENVTRKENFRELLGQAGVAPNESIMRYLMEHYQADADTVAGASMSIQCEDAIDFSLFRDGMAPTEDQMNGVRVWLAPRVLEWSVRAGHAFKVHKAVGGKATISREELKEIVTNKLRATHDLVLFRVLERWLDPQELGVSDSSAFEHLIQEFLVGTERVQRAARRLRALVLQATRQDPARIHHLFSQFDADGTGRVSMADFKQACRFLGVTDNGCTDNDLESVVKHLGQFDRKSGMIKYGLLLHDVVRISGPGGVLDVARPDETWEINPTSTSSTSKSKWGTNSTSKRSTSTSKWEPNSRSTSFRSKKLNDESSKTGGNDDGKDGFDNKSVEISGAAHSFAHTGKWVCEVCFHRNHNVRFLSKCEMCDSANVLLVKANAVGKERNTRMWTSENNGSIEEAELLLPFPHTLPSSRDVDAVLTKYGKSKSTWLS